MSFPLFVETYSINGRIYRRMPYVGQTKGANVTAAGNGDTEDVYGDEEYDEEPPCGAAGISKPKYGTEGDFAEEAEHSYPEPSSSHAINPPPSFTAPSSVIAPPPGFEQKSVDKSRGRGRQEETSVQANAVNWSVCNEDSRIERAGNKWRTRVEVPSMFHGRLIGQRGTVLREMETSTLCRVKVPNRNEKSDIVEITSTTSLENIQRCLDRIEIIVIRAKKESRPSHFACLRMTSDEVVQSYEQFKEMVMATDFISESCKDARLFMSAKKLHLTLAVMRLFTESDRAQAKEVMQSSTEIIEALCGGARLHAEVSGLRIMNDDPSNVDVLYAHVKGDLVQQVANIVRDNLASAGLCDVDTADVKLHMTVMNSRYLAEDKNVKRTPFDAKTLLEEMGEFYFGSVAVDTVSLCVMSTEGKDGFYEIVHEMKL